MRKENTKKNKEELQDENAFLKMKLMLEHGAHIDRKADENELPVELENMFLKNVMAFEEQFREGDMQTVYDVLGRPTHFAPVETISDEEISDAWKELSEYMNRYAIDLHAIAPSVTERELYRFATEELFQEEMMAMGMPGWNYNFIYDEFHPDPVYESGRRAKDVLERIFSKQDLDHLFLKRTVQLNLYKALTAETFKRVIGRFKDSFDDIILTSLRHLESTVKEKIAEVTGQYRVRCYLQGEKVIFSGKFSMLLEEGEYHCWELLNLQVAGIEF